MTITGEYLYTRFWERNGGDFPAWADQAETNITMWNGIAADAVIAAMGSDVTDRKTSAGSVPSPNGKALKLEWAERTLWLNGYELGGLYESLRGWRYDFMNDTFAMAYDTELEARQALEAAAREWLGLDTLSKSEGTEPAFQKPEPEHANQNPRLKDGWREITADQVEAAAIAIERATSQADYGWTDEQFDIWWNHDPQFVTTISNWGHFRGTKKARLLWQCEIALRAAMLKTSPSPDQEASRG